MAFKKHFEVSAAPRSCTSLDVILNDAPEFKCETCNISFTNRQHFFNHLVRVHDYRSQGKAFADGDAICKACLKHFHVRPRLIKHLSPKNSKCFKFCNQHLQPLPADVLSRLEEDDVLLKRSCRAKGISVLLANCPPVRVAGPLHGSFVALQEG